MQTSKAVIVPSLSVFECDRAKEAFISALRRYASYPDMSRETVLACAIDLVWKAGRLYQQAEDATDNYADTARLYDSIARGGAGL